ncbi:MAG: hypothetical protein QNL62_05475 [Gammaproteobacteria bacterium]|nr:hypothetical protein [Gammaproteobacteria bacterium]
MSRSADSDIFSSLIEKLLAGDVVCEISAEPMYKYLEEAVHQQDVDSYLRRIGRILRSTQDRSGYYAAYRNLSDPSIKLQIKRQFSEAINDLEPMVSWLRLATSAEKSGAPLQPGDTLRGSELLEAIENVPALIDELDRLSRSRLFNNNSTGAKKQLDSILRRLCDSGYLVTRGSSGSVFIATGKWARLYEVLQFIAAHEQLEGEEDAPAQEELIP